MCQGSCVAARTLNQLRLVGVAGANKVMAGEASRLARRAFDDVRLPAPKKQGGSLIYPFEPRLAGLWLHYHRTSARLLWDLYESDANRLEGLYEDLKRAILEDPRLRWSSGTLTLSARNVQDFAAGERQVVGAVKNALVDASRERGVLLSVDPEHFDYAFWVRGQEGRWVVSLDLAGQPMHERGYRLLPGGAPLREDLAALVVMLSRFDARNEALVDPMAGAGTLAIEAALLATAAPSWSASRRPLASSVALGPDGIDQRGPLFADTRAAVFANERDPEVFRCLEANAGTASVSLTTRLGDFRDLDPNELRQWALAQGKSSGVIVCNPPYGERTSGREPELQRTYRDLWSWCRRFRGWRLAVIVANPDFLSAMGERPRITKPLSNGPLRGYFHSFDL